VDEKETRYLILTDVTLQQNSVF